MKSFKILVASAVLTALAACGGMNNASAQSIPGPTGYALPNHAYFGPGQSVDLAQARTVDLVGGNFKVTDSNGNEINGGFMTPNVFFNTPAFQGYVRTSYNGGWRWWNVAAASRITCVNNVTYVYWINGPAANYNDYCGLQQVVDQYSRKN